MKRDDAITIIGAGPAGLASAIVLAKAGRRVVVRERRPSVGARFHGDFQGLENWSVEQDVLDELNALGVDATIEARPVRKAVAFGADRIARAVCGGAPLYYLIRRGSDAGALDAALLRAAVEAGAEVRFGDEVARTPDNAIVATGPRRADVIAAGYVFQTADEETNLACFDDRLAPSGYAYLLTAGGRGTLAVCLFREFKRHAEFLDAARRFFVHGSGIELRNARRFGGYGMVSRIPKIERAGRLLVGERAGLQDALAGFGLRYAMISGALAARSILEGLHYEPLLRKRFAAIHRAGVANRLAYDLAPARVRNFALSRIAKADARRSLQRLYGGSLLHDTLFSLASARFGARLNHPGCDHVDCDCPWCREKTEDPRI